MNLFPSSRRRLMIVPHCIRAVGLCLLCAVLVSGCRSDAAPSQLERPAWRQAAEAMDAEARASSSAEEQNWVRGVADATEAIAPEAVPIRIHLDGPAGTREAQLSGLTWWGDRLILLPQYPDFAVDATPAVYGISRSELETAVSATDGGSDTVRIRPERIPVESDVLSALSGYQGCESLVIRDGRAYATVESVGRAGGLLGMRAFIGAGTADSTSRPALSFSQTRSLPVPTFLNNMAFEALVVWDSTVIALYEANGGNVNPEPVALRVTRDLDRLEPLPMPALEYRITDATDVDSLGRFWVTNYLYRGEAAAMNPAPDSVALENGVGVSHRNRIVVERLVELQITPTRIRRTRTPPVWLKLEEGAGRNWEGIVRFRDGFLIATDTFPETLLAYVPRRVATAATSPEASSPHSRTETSSTSGR